MHSRRGWNGHLVIAVAVQDMIAGAVQDMIAGAVQDMIAGAVQDKLGSRIEWLSLPELAQLPSQ
jgi:hypothetical protein